MMRDKIIKFPIKIETEEMLANWIEAVGEMFESLGNLINVMDERIKLLEEKARTKDE